LSSGHLGQDVSRFSDAQQSDGPVWLGAERNYTRKWEGRQFLDCHADVHCKATPDNPEAASGDVP